MNIHRPNQVWVSDITYIGKREKPCYLSLITDAYSKKIVGYEVSNTMCTTHVVKALKMAHKQRKTKEMLIHHSDRGGGFNGGGKTGGAGRNDGDICLHFFHTNKLLSVGSLFEYLFTHWFNGSGRLQ